jgi:hypothetical protein
MSGHSADAPLPKYVGTMDGKMMETEKSECVYLVVCREKRGEVKCLSARNSVHSHMTKQNTK